MTDEELATFVSKFADAGMAVRTLVGEVRRLRSVIADTQDRNGYMRSHGRDWCAWCGSLFGATEDHAADCPAFMPDGRVR